ncbi:hypothetical protein GCM10028805_43020 [Spirosoma harenae]
MESLDFSKGPLKDILDAGRLHDFLLVKAPDIVGFFYHDAEDNPIDCNIYHPKYGYPGHVADSYQTTITPYNARSYQDPRTGQRVWCRDFLEVLCVHEDETYTNKDGEQVLIVSRSFPQQRLASSGNPDDFKEIYDRELAKKGLTDNKFDSEFFKDSLYKHIQDLIDLHEEKTAYEDRKFTWIGLAKEFQQYLKSGGVKKSPFNRKQSSN